jgi:hypothetical protein
MNLKGAANYFAKTPLDGWDGTVWLLSVARGTFLPHDRFISEREFGNKRRHLLVNPATPIPANVNVLRLPNGKVYLKGWLTQDITDAGEYSLIYLLHIAQYQCTVLRQTRTASASGVVSSATRAPLGTWYADAENVTFLSSAESKTMAFGDAHVILPLDCPVTNNDFLQIGVDIYHVREVHESSGFRYCRCTVERHQ